MRNATLLFLVKKEGEHISDVCLAMKKRGFGAGRWNGMGGKVQDESIESATVRETEEEVGVKVLENDLQKVGKIFFTFPAKPEWDQIVHVFLTEKWEGEPKESEEMKPEWFNVDDIPYSEMWPADRYWIPLMIEGKCINAAISFGEGDTILDQRVDVVERDTLY